MNANRFVPFGTIFELIYDPSAVDSDLDVDTPLEEKSLAEKPKLLPRLE